MKDRNDYFNSSGVSRSLLVKLLDHPRKVKMMMDGVYADQTSDALEKGSAFDSLMFDTRQEFNSKYRIAATANPFPQRNTNKGKFACECESIVKQMIEADEFFDIDNVYVKAYADSGIKNPDIRTSIKEFEEAGGRAYLEELYANAKFITLSQEEFNGLSAMKESLMSHENISHFFCDSVPEDHRVLKGNDEMLYQVDVRWQQEDLECKALLDIVSIDHERRVITGIDLKTTSFTSADTTGSILKFNYHYQAAWYRLALEAFAAQRFEGLDYTVSDQFHFIFVYTDTLYPPTIFTMSSHDMKCARDGGHRYGRPVKGICQLLSDLKWHIDHDAWDYSRDTYENGTLISTIYDR
jgi:hypothetical protein